jgi:NifU-like protein involved in Fe-S cluster formation
MDAEHDPSGLPPGLAAELRDLRHGGAPPPGASSVSGSAQNPACGDRLAIHLWRTDSGYGISFQAQSCSAVLAVASLAVNALAPRLAAALNLQEIASALADLKLSERISTLGGLPRPRAHALPVVERALVAALAAAEALPQS